MAQRKAQRMQQLSDSHSAEMSQELATQQQERDGLINKQARQVEEKALKENIKVWDRLSTDYNYFFLLNSNHLLEKSAISCC